MGHGSSVLETGGREFNSRRSDKQHRAIPLGFALEAIWKQERRCSRPTPRLPRAP
jgi:hypothetical protein